MKREKTFMEDSKEYTIYVTPELHYIKGNNAPYFSITAQIWRSRNGKRVGRDCCACGCLHEDIEKHFPNEYTDLINLHLSDINGVPMYAVENGWYWFQQNPRKGFEYIRAPYRILIEAKQDWIDFVESLKPRYKQQATEAIKKHGLVVTGDNWNQ